MNVHLKSTSFKLSWKLHLSLLLIDDFLKILSFLYLSPTSTQVTKFKSGFFKSFAIMSLHFTCDFRTALNACRGLQPNLKYLKGSSIIFFLVPSVTYFFVTFLNSKSVQDLKSDLHINNFSSFALTLRSIGALATRGAHLGCSTSESLL